MFTVRSADPYGVDRTAVSPAWHPLQVRPGEMVPHSQNRGTRAAAGRPGRGNPRLRGQRFEPRGSPFRTGRRRRREPQRRAQRQGQLPHKRRRSGRVTYRPKATAMLTVHARTEDERLLSPRQRAAFLNSEPWRWLRIVSKRSRGSSSGGRRQGDRHLRLGPDARGRPLFAQAHELAANLAREGFAVITGGGPRRHGGRRTAARRGQRLWEVGATRRCGSPHEQAVNRTSTLASEAPLFFARKVMLVNTPSGFRHIPRRLPHAGRSCSSRSLSFQTGKIRHFPVL